MKERYIDLIEKVFTAYTDEHIKEYTDDVFENGIREHGYPRLVANLGILVAHGRKTNMKNDLKKMMDFCCENIPCAMEKWGDKGEVGNDFSVKEIVLSILEIEKSGIFSKEITDGWRAKLSEINPFKTYRVIAENPPKRINNWAAFNGASEQVRKYAGIGDESAYIDNQVKSQLFSFDENGMYRDPHEPMVYDMVTRLQLAIILNFGYDGDGRAELEEKMMKAAHITLLMQSVTGEIPYGGRSNQFLHNEAFYAALCEFYAAAFKKKGNIKMAEKFKYAAKKATDSICPWLEGEQIRHIKNYYGIKSMYGCEIYAHFNKYMITTASWLYIAYALADDSIKEDESESNYICETSPHFHKVFAKYNDYFIEIDTDADFEYDGGGLGRVHKRGVPSAICLSLPFSTKPNYELDIKNSMPLSICAGVEKNDNFVYSCEENTKYTLLEKKEEENKITIKYKCTVECGADVLHTVTLSDDGVKIKAEGEGKIRILLPAFYFDGENYTKIKEDNKNVSILYKNHICKYESESDITRLSGEFANRNGHYKCFAAENTGEVSVKIAIE